MQAAVEKAKGSGGWLPFASTRARAATAARSRREDDERRAHILYPDAEATRHRDGAGVRDVRAFVGASYSGGSDAFQSRLGGLAGYPAVVNVWASWCGPCRFEFPWFQSLAEKRGGQIAFLGVNSNDSDGTAKQFLSELPLPYPSYSDPDLQIAQDLGGPPQAFPTTTYYDRSGKQVFSHPGVYANEQQLIADVNRYAG